MVYIVFFTTVCYRFVINGSMNALMLCVMFVSPIFLCIFFPRMAKSEIPLYTLAGCIAFASILHISSFRIATIAYSFLFIGAFIFYKRMLATGAMDKMTYLNLIKYVVYAYFVVLLMQQLMTMAGLSVFNKCWDFPNPYKLNSLALEPSYIGGTLLVLMYSYIKVFENTVGREYSIKKDFVKHKYMWIAYAYVSLTCCSSWSLFAFALMVCYLLRKKKMLLSSFVVGGVAFYSFVNVSDLDSLNRLIKIIPAIFTGDTNYIKSIDLSAASRINPVIFYFQDFDLLSMNLWFGNGVDFSKTHTIVRLLGNSNYMEQGNATGGLFPAFFLDYGLISGSLFLFCLRKYAVIRFRSFLFVSWLICFLPIAFNTYMTWLFFIISYSTSYYLGQKDGSQRCKAVFTNDAIYGRFLNAEA